MKKILQNMMYVVSLIIAVGVMVALVRAGGKTAQTQNAVSNAQLPVTEENVTLDGNPAPEKATETEQLSEEASETEKETTLPIEDAETENAEVIPDEDTTIIFTGDVLFANAFKEIGRAHV